MRKTSPGVLVGIHDGSKRDQHKSASLLRLVVETCEQNPCDEFIYMIMLRKNNLIEVAIRFERI
jgi:hypothetical protein